MFKIVKSSFVCAALVLALAVPSLSSANAPDPVQVKIGNFVFIPAMLTVPAGTHLTFVNEDDVPHIVIGTDPGSPIKSPPLDSDERYEVTITQPGTYKYFCSIHPHMVGTIVVK